MKIAILAAMDKEVQLLMTLLEHPLEMQYENLTLQYGFVGEHEIFIAKCGIGKVNSAINTYRIIKAVNPDLVLNSGVAGGAGIPIGSLLIVDKICYYDVWCGPGTKWGEADGYPLFMMPDEKIIKLSEEVIKNDNVVYGLICSGDKFVSSADEIAFIRSHFPEVKAVDMESASIAQTCMLCNVPFNIIRIVSDTPGEGENISQYENFFDEAPEKTFSLLNEIIKNL